MRLVRGDHVHLRPPRERPIGELRYREWFGPLRTARQITAERLAIPLPTFELGSVSAPDRLTTVEGEHAALIKIEGRFAQRPARRVIGIAFGDYTTALLDGMSIVPEHFAEFEATMRDLTRRTTLVLGTRRRRFVYQRPYGWHAIANVLITHYLPLDYPLNNSRITVYPALPLEFKGLHLFDVVLAEERGRGAAIIERAPAAAITTTTGLEGGRMRIVSQVPDGVPVANVLVVFEDKRYTYPLRLQVTADDAEQPSDEAFTRLWQSVEAIGAPVGVEEEVAQNFDFWAL